MSKKGSDTPSSIRIRENQRRSRNQRKELIQDLQRRVQEYEAKGIAATQEMQRAARKVADENARLRSLLSSHGVAHEEVEAYLRSFDAASASQHMVADLYAHPASRPSVPTIPGGSSVGKMALPVSHARAATSAQPQVQAPAQATFPQPIHPPPQPSASAYADSHTVCHSFSNIQHATCDAEDENLTTMSSPAASSLGGRDDANCPNTTSCFCPSPSAPQEQSMDSGLLISCETAASIIAEMRGDGDRQRIRASLGCRGDKECSVKNALVLELMDER